MSCGITHPIGCLSSAAKSVAGDAFNAIAKDFANAADSTISWLWGQLSDATAVHLGGAGFSLDLAIVVAITGVVAVGLFVLQLITSVLRRDPSGVGRAAKGLVVAFIAGGVAVGITNVALGAIDALSNGVVQMAMGTTINHMGQKLVGRGAIVAVNNPAGMFLLAIVAIVSCVIVWAALVIRKALIVVSAVFAPLAFAGSLADITVGWTRKWIEVMTALVVSKLVLVLIFLVGWGILAGGAGRSGRGTTQTITQTATGLLILALAGFAPWMALKLVHFTENEFHRLHVLAGNATSGARTAAAAPQKVAAWKATAASFGATAAVGAGGAAAAGATASPGAGGAPKSGGGAGPSNGAGPPSGGGGAPPNGSPSGGSAGPGKKTDPAVGGFVPVAGNGSGNGQSKPAPGRPAPQPQPVR